MKIKKKKENCQQKLKYLANVNSMLTQFSQQEIEEEEDNTTVSVRSAQLLLFFSSHESRTFTKTEEYRRRDWNVPVHGYFHPQQPPGFDFVTRVLFATCTFLAYFLACFSLSLSFSLSCTGPLEITRLSPLS